MSDELKLRLAVDERDAVKGVTNLGDAVEDLADEFVDLENVADRELGQIESALRKVATVAKREGKDAGKGLAKGIKSGTSEAKEEIASSGREAAASFSGGFEDVGDFVQESLANALGGFGPLGAAAGVALAAVVGTVMSQAQAAQERIQEARQAASELAQTLYENRGTLPITDQVSKLFQLLEREAPGRGIEAFFDQWQDFGPILDDLRRGARNAGIPLQNLLRTLGGTDGATARRMLEQINTQIRELATSSGLGLDQSSKESLDALTSVRTELENTIRVADAAEAAAAAVGGAYKQSAGDLRTHAEDVADLSTAWQNAATDASAYFTTSEEGVTTFDWGSYLEDAEQAVKDSNFFKSELLKLPPEIRDEATRIFGEQGAASAAAYIKAYETEGPKVKQRLSAAARANGTTAGTAAAEAMRRAAELQASRFRPIDVPFLAKVDDSALRYYQRNPPVVYVPWRLQSSPSGRQPV